MGTSNFRGAVVAIQQDRWLVEVETSGGPLLALGEEELRKGEKVTLKVRPEYVIMIEQGHSLTE